MTALAKHHAGLIAAGIVGGFSGIRHAVTSALRMASETPSAVPGSLAALAVAQSVTFDPAKASAALGDLYDSASELAGGTTTQDLLASRGITLSGISNSAMKRMSDAIGQGIANGDTHTTISDAVNSIIADPARANVIAATEGSRAYNAAFVDTLVSAGETEFNWVNDEDPCPECEAELGLHDITDDPPPIHPSCRCICVMVPSA